VLAEVGAGAGFKSHDYQGCKEEEEERPLEKRANHYMRAGRKG
jgi:hypothetical protein